MPPVSKPTATARPSSAGCARSRRSIGITGGLAARGVTRAHLPQLVPLAAKDFTAQTNPRPTVEADYERFFLAAM